MERNPQSLPFRWIVVLILVCTRTENLLAFARGPSKPLVRGAPPGRVQPFSTEAERSPASAPPDHSLSVLVRCHSDSMELVVQADLFNQGLRVDGGHLRLGWSSAAEGGVCGATASGEAEFIIRVSLMDCGMKLSVSTVAFFFRIIQLIGELESKTCFQSTEEMIIYSNVLSYSPEPSQGGLLRLEAATIPIECHYKK